MTQVPQCTPETAEASPYPGMININQTNYINYMVPYFQMMQPQVAAYHAGPM